MHEPTPQSDASADYRLHNVRADIDRVEEEVVRHLERLGYPGAAGFAVRLAMEEAIVNAFRHGHREKPHEPIRVHYRVSPEHATVVVHDSGPGFDPQETPDPTADENLELPSGRGLLLMRSFMAEVAYDDQGRRVTMIYRRDQAG